MEDENSDQSHQNEDLLALADSMAGSLAALLASNDAPYRQKTLRSMQPPEQSVSGGNSSPQPCGVFRKMRYIPGKLLDDEVQHEKPKSFSPELGLELSLSPMPRSHTPLLQPCFEDSPKPPTQLFNDDSIYKKSESLSPEPRKPISTDLIRGDAKRTATNRIRSTSPQGRIKVLNDSMSAQDTSRKIGANISPRRSLSPRRNVIGPAGAFSSKGGKGVDALRENEVFNPREPAGAFRRKKPLVRASNSFTADPEFLSESENPFTPHPEGMPFSITAGLSPIDTSASPTTWLFPATTSRNPFL
jgi:hypothetical protein